MTCIEKIYSVSALIGNSNCNANCKFCAGKIYRENSWSRKDRLNWEKNLEAAIKLSARYGGWSLSLTSGGEPLVAPNNILRALEIYNNCAVSGAFMPNVNLFTNGILLGDEKFCEKWLPWWKSLGLTNIAVSVHSPVNSIQAKAYGVESYPDFKIIAKNVRKHGLGIRATLLLQKGYVDCADLYEDALEKLFSYSYDNITSWPVGNPDGTRNEFTPSRWNLFKIKRRLNKIGTLCHGHAWGGGVYDVEGKLVRITDYVTKHDPKKNFVRQLVVLNDGTVNYSWISKGAICLK